MRSSRSSFARTSIQLIAVTFVIVGCGGSGPTTGSVDASRADSSAPGDGGAPRDAFSPPDAARGGSYRTCTSTAECPAGDVCDFIWPSTTDPVPDPPPTSYCQPACVVDDDCTNDAYGDLDVPGVCQDGRCMLYCAVGGLVPTCEAPYRCAYWRPASPRDGYCVLD